MITVRMRRGGKYENQESETPPTLEVQNFWDLLDFLRSESPRVRFAGPC